MTTDNRVKRPNLERERPNRNWSTLFSAPEAPHTQQAGAHHAGDHTGSSEPIGPDHPFGNSASGAPLADAVERAYRVVNEYMRQGQSLAQGFNPTPPMNAAQTGSPPDLQQLTQRLMQSGWDFAGLWFEMSTQLSAAANGRNASRTSPPDWPSPNGSAAPQPPPVEVPEPRKAASVVGATRVSVSVISRRSTATTLDLQPGAVGPLAIHALRAEGLDAPPIRDVKVECRDAEGPLTITLRISADQPPGVYNGVIIDTTSSLPRGTLSLTIYGDEGG